MLDIHPGEAGTRGREIGQERRATRACELLAGHRVGERFEASWSALSSVPVSARPKSSANRSTPLLHNPSRGLRKPRPEDCGEVSEDENDRPRRAPDMDVANE